MNEVPFILQLWLSVGEGYLTQRLEGDQGSIPMYQHNVIAMITRQLSPVNLPNHLKWYSSRMVTHMVAANLLKSPTAVSFNDGTLAG